MNISKRDTVFSTPWFKVVAKSVQERKQDEPHYCVEMADYVSVLAMTKERQVVLVRQYRPTVEKSTLEFPSGYVEKGESPEEAAKRELFEETGYSAPKMELLGSLWPDTGRLSNQIWTYLALNAIAPDSMWEQESGVEVVLLSPKELMQKIRTSDFKLALHYAVLFLASAKQGLSDLGDLRGSKP